jgi:hypothetical protein
MDGDTGLKIPDYDNDVRSSQIAWLKHQLGDQENSIPAAKN